MSLERVIENLLRSNGDAYTVLGLLPTATPENIKEAHRNLASLLHPDRNPGNLGAAAAMAKVNTAYATLMDGKTRKKHDLLAGRNKVCARCKGTGKVSKVGKGFSAKKSACPECDGTGKK